MEREVAKTLLSGKVAATSRPVLSDSLLDALLLAYPKVDDAGRGPRDAGWSGDWDLNAAAAEGWRMKASMVAGDFNFSADGASYSKADVLAHCLEMETKYASLNHGVMRLDNAADAWPLKHRDWDGDEGGGTIP